MKALQEGQQLTHTDQLRQDTGLNSAAEIQVCFEDCIVWHAEVIFTRKIYPVNFSVAGCTIKRKKKFSLHYHYSFKHASDKNKESDHQE